jgi:ribosome-associated protein
LRIFNITASQLLSNEQKTIIKEKLSNRINAEDEVVVKAQTHRTQLANKAKRSKR